MENKSQFKTVQKVLIWIEVIIDLSLNFKKQALKKNERFFSQNKM